MGMKEAVAATRAVERFSGAPRNASPMNRCFGHAYPNILCSCAVFFLTTFLQLLYCPLRFGGTSLALSRSRGFGRAGHAAIPGLTDTTTASQFRADARTSARKRSRNHR